MIYGYLRVSSDAQDVNSQKQGVDGFAKAKGWEIEKYISDEGISGGTDPDKRKLGPMLKKLQKGDIVICSEISRLGRDLYMVMDVLHFCMTKEVVIYTVKDRFVLGDDIQSKVLAFAFGLSAEIERQMIKQRTLEGLRLRKKMGVLMGRPPRKKTTFDYAPLAKYKELIIDHYKNGVSGNEIARLIKIDRNTLHRALVRWDVWEPRTKNGAGPKSLEEAKANMTRAETAHRVRVRERLGIKQPTNNIDVKKLQSYILADMTIPEIAEKFPLNSYDEVYAAIDCNDDLNLLYRAHAQKKLLKKRW
jgi:DNA invertase Pin-like site-specific DNA recombinase